MHNCSYNAEKNYFEIVPERCGITLHDLFLSLGDRIDFAVPSVCGGEGLCGKCAVRAFGGLTPPDKKESTVLSEQQLREGIRLACRARVTGEPVYLPNKALQTVELNGAAEVLTDSFITYQEHKTDHGKVGVAVDVGTTTVAVYLTTKKETVLKMGFLNPLQRFGGDVITLINSIKNNKTTAVGMQEILVESIEDAVVSLANSDGIDIGEIYQMVIAGNTVMEHILCGLDPCDMSVAPYTPRTLFGCSYSSEKLSFKKIRSAEVFLMPCISSFVGGDISAGLLASGILKDRLPPLFNQETVLYIDIGTNGELVLCHEGDLYTCSCAAGPAFEGANIECGTVYCSGAVESVSVSEKINCGDKTKNCSTGLFDYKTAGDISAVGICGSGIVDAIAAMLELKLIDKTGRMMAEDGRVYIDKEKKVYISAQDVRNVQLAKSAVASGIEVLVKRAGIDVNDVEKVFLAGGFGTKLNKRSLCRIGVIPCALEERITALGNMSAAGALRCLYSRQNKDTACHIAKMAFHVELSEQEDFADIFADNLFFE